MPEIALRDANAEDVPFLAQVSLLATRSHKDVGFYDVMLGLPDEALLTRLEAMAMAPSRSFHHYSRRIVATVDGAPAASLAAFPGGEESLIALRDAVLAVLSSEELQQMAARRAPLDTCLMLPEDGAWVVEVVATLPQYRRLGLTLRLLNEALDRGRAAGFTKANVQVEIGNTPAINAYQAAGFTVVNEKRHPDFEAVMHAPGIYLLSRPL